MPYKFIEIFYAKVFLVRAEGIFFYNVVTKSWLVILSDHFFFRHYLLFFIYFLFPLSFFIVFTAGANFLFNL